MAKRYEKTDEELLILIRSGDMIAFSELYSRYWDILLDAAYQRLKSVEAAEEIVQDVFVNIYIRRESLDPGLSVVAYLKTALKYKIYNAYRDNLLHQQRLEMIAYEGGGAPLRPDDAYQEKELQEQVQQIAAALPDKCREVFLLSRFEQLTQQEIADRMNIAVSTVKKHLGKALAIFRTHFPNNRIDMIFIIFLFFFRF
ncbi:RNA polymerase sigma-70 factor, ECF subfamily [bacterium A37T11]|nr:RNA polymerase sigma-70 factor, ECF subfamily [bacterium A37T11]